MVIEEYRKYRWFYTSKNTLVVGGKNADQNDELLRRVLSLKKEYYVLHTSAPGSPFAVLLKDPAKVTPEELHEAAIFTACFSRAWKERKKKAMIDIFRTDWLMKDKEMKAGSWKVAGAVQRIEAPLELVLTFQRKTLRAVPANAAKNVLLKLTPGKVDKQDMAARVAVELDQKIGIDELLAALPAGGISLGQGTKK